MSQSPIWTPNPYQAPKDTSRRGKRPHSLSAAETLHVIVAWLCGISFYLSLKMAIHGPPDFLASWLPPQDSNGIVYSPAAQAVLISFILCLGFGTKLLLTGSRPARWLGTIPMLPLIAFFLYVIAGRLGDQIGY